MPECHKTVLGGESSLLSIPSEEGGRKNCRERTHFPLSARPPGLGRHPVKLRASSRPCVQELLLEVLMGPCEVLGIEPRSAVCQASARPAVPSLQHSRFHPEMEKSDFFPQALLPLWLPGSRGQALMWTRAATLLSDAPGYGRPLTGRLPHPVSVPARS